MGVTIHRGGQEDSIANLTARYPIFATRLVALTSKAREEGAICGLTAVSVVTRMVATGMVGVSSGTGAVVVALTNRDDEGVESVVVAGALRM